MKSKKIDYTDEQIKEEFSDVIEELLLDEIYTNEKYAIALIKEILSFGINRNNHTEILEIISTVDSMKNQYAIDKANQLKTDKSQPISNRKAIKSVINYRYKENELNDFEQISVESIVDAEDRTRK